MAAKKAKKDDMMAMLRQAADARKDELSGTRAAISSGGKGPGRPSRYTDDDPKSGLTLAIKTSSKIKAKKLAIDTGKTVSELFEEWIDNYTPEKGN